MRENASRDSLNSLLRGELSAVETYRLAIEKLEDSASRSLLEEARLSHEQRVETLKRRILELGGEPATSSGPWGAFAKLVEGAASMFGDKAAIAALEEGEDHGLKDYRAELDKLDPESRRMVEAQLLPAQERTHSTLSSLKHSTTDRTYP